MWGVSIHWTGLLDWNTGLDYWTELFSFFEQVCVYFSANLEALFKNYCCTVAICCMYIVMFTDKRCTV